MQQDWDVSVYFISSCTKQGCFTRPKFSTERDRRQNVEGMMCLDCGTLGREFIARGIFVFLPQASIFNEILNKEKAALIKKHKYTILTGFKMCLCYAVKFDV